MSKVGLDSDPKKTVARFKVCVFGDAGVGKTSLTQRFLTGVFKEKYKTTIGMDFYIKKIFVEKKRISLQVWDFAGEEKFKFLLPTNAKGTDAAIFMFDITRYNTLKNLNNWITLFQNSIEKKKEELPIILVGGKSDLDYYRSVPPEKAVKLAEEYEMFQYIETSAKEGKNVQETFELLAQRLIQINKLA